ncbi:MAG: Fe-S cluster assembly ATPase SufC [Pseudomonadota bacterium]|nr:Fe-S cluster assembly ATPase SufC [Pseudomonadota bacterium]
MIKIQSLRASVQEKNDAILQGVDLHLEAGEVHAIMGPNGSGKSTLSNVLTGHPDYNVESGSIEFMGQDLLAMSPEERACAGVFMAFQYPISLPGVSTLHFLQTVMNHQRKIRGETLLDAFEVISRAEHACKLVGLPNSFLERPLNDGFSGGEKKRCEVLQMLLLQPKLVILDETDSGLDIDALQMVGKAVDHLRDKTRSFLVVTHYQRLLNHIIPDQVHIMLAGKMVQSGGQELAKKLEQQGYGWLQQS